MEQYEYSQYLMWTKRKHHHILNSWEEQAFAHDDAYGWPPRSYTCSFCKKEFRSAQALGGHMNVHRRDRARLNNQSQVCPQTQLTSSTHKVCTSNSSNPRQNFTSKLAQQNEIGRLVHSIENSKTVACKNSTDTSSEEYSRFFQGHAADGGDDFVETNLSVGLSFAVSRSRAAAGDINGDHCNKRRKTEDVFPLPFWFKGCSNDHEKDNIDLELKLGDSPIVN